MFETRAVLLAFATLLAMAWPALPIAAESNDEVAEELGRIDSKQLTEVSGMVASRQNAAVLWLHNDGDSRHVFAVETSGRLAAQVRCAAPIEDLEDIAIGPGPVADRDYLYLGDIGDNDRRRREIQVIRIPEPRLEGNRPSLLEAESIEVFRLAYPDGAHDAETLIVDPLTGDLLVATKQDRAARVYGTSADRLDQQGVVILSLLATLRVAQVSAGDISPDGSRILLRTEARGWLWQREGGTDLAAALNGSPTTVPVRGERQGKNGESIAFAPDGQSYYTVSEGKRQRIFVFRLPSP